ncbi:Deoxycytidylate deaminase [Trichinella zimbabwensis]|uniref:Small ribosomal subunit protein eS21 n=1 Tax=Trichinella zimbabwensis TaxID=268475 RepID=A0A0V1HUD1_9BILA|nr:Deoxycytidylate deaminase [Trichinella zimbabwensis]
MTLDMESFFMGIACLSSKRSKDPVTQVGACIVNSSGIIVSTGYNGMPVGCDDNVLPWGKNLPNVLETKHPFVCHAELNALLNASTSELSGCSMQNELGEYVDLYIPRKWLVSASSRIVSAKDHASVQIEIAKVNPVTGKMTGDTEKYAISGAIRRMGESDDSINRLAVRSGLMPKDFN